MDFKTPKDAVDDRVVAALKKMYEGNLFGTRVGDAIWMPITDGKSNALTTVNPFVLRMPVLELCRREQQAEPQQMN